MNLAVNNYRSLYANKCILGPMVRVGTLPMRLLALRHGVDLVYTEEIIDFKLIKSHRYVNNELNTVDFIDDYGMVIFRTCQEETSKVILQLGTNDARRAVMAAKMMENDVAGIDINMGCPKSFSLKGGMGAALLQKPDRIKEILTLLKANIKRGISCKIRVFDDLQKTLELVKMIESTGVDAIAIHGRTKEERPQHQNRNNYIRAIADAVQIPVIANGGSSEINCYEDIIRFKTDTNSSSVMISRAAMKNCTIFNKSNKPIENIEQVITDYLKLAIQYDNNAINTKYCIQQMLGSQQETVKGKLVLGSYDLFSLSAIYGLQDYYDSKTNEIKAIKERTNDLKGSNIATDDETSVVEMPVIFDKNLFFQGTLPKNILNRWVTKNSVENPIYNTCEVDKLFHTTVCFLGKKYSTPYLEKTKRHAEQSAALVVVLALGLCQDCKVLDSCLVTGQNQITSLERTQNDRTYLIKVNK